MVDGPFRAGESFSARLDDHEGRIEVLEFFADGRAKCSGDELWENVKRMNSVIRTLRYTLISMMVMFAITIFMHLYFTERLVNESEARFHDHDHKIQRVEHQLKELRVLGYKTLDAVERP